MPKIVEMTNKQSVDAGLSPIDMDNQPILEMPEGSSVEFLSSDPSVADFEEDASGLNGTVTSGKVGTASISGKLRLADGTVFEDTLTVVVKNSAPGSANFTVGTPRDE